MRIILADDHKIIRDGLHALIKKQLGFEIIAEAKDGRTTVQLSKELLPDVVIMDIAMPDLNGIEATRQIIAENPGIKVIALSMHSDRRFVEEMFKAGAFGYILKDCAFEELSKAINTVMENKYYLCSSISCMVVKEYLKRLKNSDTSAFSVLTQREREVLQLLAEGKSTNMIASILCLSEKTIETHRRQIMKKLNLYSVAELTKYAIREGMTTLN